VLVLLLQPETGDDLQWEKAGVLEMADVVFIHKADLPGAEQVEAQVRVSLALSSSPQVPILRGSARNGTGLEELWAAILSRPLRRRQRADMGAELLHLAQAALTMRLAAAEAAQDPELKRLLARWQTGNLSGADAGVDLLQLLASGKNRHTSQ
jgi:putative protein kinase ArgK-like GTPase of G3E family